MAGRGGPGTIGRPALAMDAGATVGEARRGLYGVGHATSMRGVIAAWSAGRTTWG